ncbi:ankyrin repeat domain-containing protein [Wolbachia endosymbiont (group A) of Bombylius major]|uniref:ankyrin repeat domain-containing protein n=1 Tax=Wolbachia endosymbiont (group A) of Bombylius major TaxID=2953988 RepID=UPI0022318F24|nr:ankyrin repeat domain-containing protein [Wolbachia endosymbiont (group A) of Bombylius major]
MLYGENRTNTNGYRYQRTRDAPTQKLFKAIDDENLEAFKQALEGDADVNAFDKGYTPLMTLIMNGDDSPICLKMMMLLLQHQSLNINAQETKEHNTALHLAFRMENRNFIRMLLRHPNLDIYVKNSYLLIKPEYQQLSEEYLRDFHKERFFHTPKEYIEKVGRIQKRNFSHLTMEIMEAEGGKAFLESFSFLASSSMWVTQMLLNYNDKPNPNCWKRNQNGEIETPLSLIIKSCLQGITQDNEEVLTKLLKHKDLDFSQIKPIQDMEKNPWVKQIIKQAITERLTATINKKDLDDVKKLVEDNCFMSHAIVTAALRGVNNPIESITNYLNEKFPVSAEQPVANTHNVQPEINDEFIARELQQLENFRDEFERKEAQLTEKKKELKQKKLSQQAGVNDLSSQLTQLTKKIAQSRKQNGYAVASFVLSVALVVGACLTTPNLEICIPLAVTAFAFFTIGCYCLYKTKTALSDVRSTQLGNVISLE